jgi:hypothetical protein
VVLNKVNPTLVRGPKPTKQPKERSA